MSEDTPDISTESEPPRVRPALGSVLRSAREQSKLEIDDVAQQLRMSAYQVNALEQDNHVALPAPTFVRGFIRNYARLLHLDAGPLLDAYQQIQPDSQLHNSISLKLESIPITNNAQKSFRLYLLTSFLLIVIGSGWWLYMAWNDKQEKMHTTHAAVAMPEEAAAKPTPSPEPNQQVQAAQPTPSSNAQPSAPTPQQPVQPTAVPIPVAAPAPIAQKPVVATPAAQPVAAPPVSLAPPATPVVAPVATKPVVPGSIRMTFTEQTWVSVTDATGKEVFNKNKAANTEDSAEGTPPFNIVIGNAAGLQMFYKDQPVDITSHTKSNVARFTLPQP
jgi:cytoskeleton protein RodZ